MYVPAAFAETDLTKLHDFIEQYSFGVLVSQREGAPFASHLPFLLDRKAGPHGSLAGHMARANPHWREADGQTALAIFAGRHAYISPAWYEEEQVVPTWNYTAVHVTGQLQLVEDEAALLEILRRSVDYYESNRPRPWSFALDDKYIRGRLAQIVGFRLNIEKIEGKWKLNQNHPVERRRKVVRALRERGGPDDAAIAAMIEATLPKK